VGKIKAEGPEFDEAEANVRARLDGLMAIGRVKSGERRTENELPQTGTLHSPLSTLHSVDHYHKALGRVMWEYCGMARSKESLATAATKIAELEADFYQHVFIPGKTAEMNPELEKAYRLADYFELARLIVDDATQREESCGGHFRVEHQTEDGETLRDDDNFMFVAAWEYQGHDNPEVMHKEELNYEHIQIVKRNYK
jgi:succinate dehydrogenase / fumarate reductase flavoprotein subunit